MADVLIKLLWFAAFHQLNMFIFMLLFNCLAEMNEYMRFYRDIPAFAIWS